MNNYSLLESYLQQLKSCAYSLQTLRAYQKDLSQFLDFLESSSCNLENFGMDIARVYLVNFKKSQLSLGSICRKISVLRNFMKFLQHGQTLDQNPFQNLKVTKISIRLPTCLIYQDITRMIGARENSYLGYRDRAIFELLYSSGSRTFKIIQFNVFQIRNRTIAFLAKGNKPHFVSLGSPSKTTLNKYLTLKKKYEKNLPYEFLNTQPIF